MGIHWTTSALFFCSVLVACGGAQQAVATGNFSQCGERACTHLELLPNSRFSMWGTGEMKQAGRREGAWSEASDGCVLLVFDEVPSQIPGEEPSQSKDELRACSMPGGLELTVFNGVGKPIPLKLLREGTPSG